MDLLSKLEKTLERTIEGFFARSTRGRVQPLEIAKRLSREMERGRMVSVSGTYAPNRFEVFLSAADLAHLRPFEVAMLAEIGTYLRSHTEHIDCQLMGPVEIILTEEASLPEGELRIVSQVVAAPMDEDTQVRPRPRAARLVVEAGPETSRAFTLVQPIEAIGREPDNSVCLRDRTVSRHHAKMRLEGERYWLVDLGSTNGTHVNGERISRVELADGDLIQVGATSLRFGVA